MSFYKVTVTVSGRNLESIVKEGVIATTEVGKHENKIQRPQTKVSILAGQKAGKPSAWVQVSKANDAGSFVISHEGWITSDANQLNSLTSDGSAAVTMESIARDNGAVGKLALNAEFGTRGCCTAYGNGCYITCCNACCSDPTGCPGASCCG
jgi:hypothetical protein